MLLDVDVCAEFPSDPATGDENCSARPLTTELTSNDSGVGNSSSSSSITSDSLTGDGSTMTAGWLSSHAITTTAATTVAAASGVGGEELEPSSEPLTRRPLGGTAKEDRWVRLQRRLLVFPALLRPTPGSRGGSMLFLGSASPQWQSEGRDGVAGSREGEERVFVAGRRVRCRSAMFLLGLFHMVQARLANR